MYEKIIVILIVILLVVAVYLMVTRAPSAPSVPIDVASETLPPVSNTRLYRIVSESSSITFSIGEILNGAPFTAVGTTSQVAGDIMLDDTTVTMGTLSINARTFKTDNSRRDGAISRAILKAEDPANEFIRFQPSKVTGVSVPAEGASSTVSYNVSGDLTVAGMTKPATFSVTMHITDDLLTGTATTTISRADFGLIIPNVPFVAEVDDKFTVTADISAGRVEGR